MFVCNHSVSNARIEVEMAGGRISFLGSESGITHSAKAASFRIECRECGVAENDLKVGLASSSKWRTIVRSQNQGAHQLVGNHLHRLNSEDPIQFDDVLSGCENLGCFGQLFRKD